MNGKRRGRAKDNEKREQLNRKKEKLDFLLKLMAAAQIDGRSLSRKD